jgi:hypothetical protein
VVGTSSCFVAGTPLLTPAGAKAIEQFRVGDLILSRAEQNPQGPVEVKVVEETFVRVAPGAVPPFGRNQVKNTAI